MKHNSQKNNELIPMEDWLDLEWIIAFATANSMDYPLLILDQCRQIHSSQHSRIVAVVSDTLEKFPRTGLMPIREWSMYLFNHVSLE